MKTAKKKPRKPRYREPQYLDVPAPRHLEAVQGRRWMLVSAAATLTGMSVRTVLRWRRHGIPTGSHLYTLQSKTFGLLPHPRWNEYQLCEDGTINHWTGKRALSGLAPNVVGDIENMRHTMQFLYGEVRRLNLLVRSLRTPPPERWPPEIAANDDDSYPQQLLVLF